MPDQEQRMELIPVKILRHTPVIIFSSRMIAGQ